MCKNEKQNIGIFMGKTFKEAKLVHMLAISQYTDLFYLY